MMARVTAPAGFSTLGDGARRWAAGRGVSLDKAQWAVARAIGEGRLAMIDAAGLRPLAPTPDDELDFAASEVRRPGGMIRFNEVEGVGRPIYPTVWLDPDELDQLITPTTIAAATIREPPAAPRTTPAARAPGRPAVHDWGAAERQARRRVHQHG
jgi:hypothetical protein